MLKAKFVGDTWVQRGGGKDRWECPSCRSNPNKPECRFNLSPEKRGRTHKCRFCGTELLLKK